MAKYEIHQRTVALNNNFDKVWEYLNNKCEVTLRTEKNRISFIALASKAVRGKHEGEKLIRVLNAETRKASAYVFKCCWGYHTNCYGDGTRIGMYCEVLDSLVSSEGK